MTNTLSIDAIRAADGSGSVDFPAGLTIAGQTVTPGGGGALPYKVYSALLTQIGANAPVATLLQNTLGGTPVWTRSDVGTYVCTLAGAFPTGKVFIPAIPRLDGNAYLDVDNAVTITATVTVNSVTLTTYVSSNGLEDGWIGGTILEIRVYP
jgi:hypothetical protein